ncbi:uncharacterized protein LOC125039866 [Penaeus chinensis]|uniref:uncharacterized protein LOC125039866 n=1 Tax=Penaeus chinensis TaxID=139456 RepID=UPI001FB7CB6E|nr:uncharacterized protein LOC125039866 [Penaeus chinensis]
MRYLKLSFPHLEYEAANPIFHDIALLQVEKVPITSFPHVNLVCLPDSDILYMNTRLWDCYTVGWQGKSEFLKRIEANIASRRLCHVFSHAFSNSAGGKEPHKYYWSHGYHLLEYHNFRSVLGGHFSI